MTEEGKLKNRTFLMVAGGMLLGAILYSVTNWDDWSAAELMMIWGPLLTLWVGGKMWKSKVENGK